MYTLKTAAAYFGVSFRTLEKRVRKVFPDRPRRNPHYFTEAEVRLLCSYDMRGSLARQAIAQGGVTVKALAEKLRRSPETVKRHIRVLCPEVLRKGFRTYLLPDQAERVTASIAGYVKKKPGRKTADLQSSDSARPVLEPVIGSSPSAVKGKTGGPSLESLKRISAEEIVARAERFRKWYVRKIRGP